ncbi:MAG: hypothetical protein D6730_03900 [Bacteroidetes bacterium]|nr:MAG: hypothetical protein D6730_03900 [Bacteroidota bacterium]
MLLLGCACEFINPEESLPAYLHIADAQIQLDKQFYSKLGVKDVWLENGNAFVGVYQLPASIPLFVEEKSNIIIRGGVFLNGLSAQRRAYPFWQPLSLGLETQPLDTFRLSPTFSYFPDSLLRFPFIESFEGASLKLVNNSPAGQAARLQLTRNTVFQGRASGHVRFDAQASSFEAVSGDFFALPQENGAEVYAEITYSNDIPFSAGLKFASALETGERAEPIFFNSGLQWQTIYLYLTPLIQTAPAGSAFGLFIRAEGEGKTGDLFLDNIRLIHFK